MGRAYSPENHGSDASMNMAQRRNNLYPLLSGTCFAGSRSIPVRWGVQMNALDLLTGDHQKVRQLFQQVQQIRDNDQKKKLFDQIDTELAVHAEIEETIFYPALEEHDELKDMVREAREEHEQVAR
jgi:hypothetical protein